MTSSATLRNAFIFHGYAATPDDHWFRWLAARLDERGIGTRVPALPDSREPDAARWQEKIRGEVGAPRVDTVIVAHSLGCLTVLRYLASLTGAWRLGGLVLISGFLDRLPALPELDEVIGDGCDVSGVRGRVDRIRVLRSDDDPLVPPAYTDRLAGLLGVTPVVVPGARHFLADDGHSALPAAYEAVVS